MAKEAGIDIYHHSLVCDHDLNSYGFSAFQACLLLHKLVNEQRLKVFVFCSAGVSRCSTVFLAFVALFGLKATESFSDENSIFKPDALFRKSHQQLILELEPYLKKHHSRAMPNLQAVRQIIDMRKVDY